MVGCIYWKPSGAPDSIGILGLGAAAAILISYSNKLVGIIRREILSPHMNTFKQRYLTIFLNHVFKQCLSTNIGKTTFAKVIAIKQ
jgi:hypothetical protein